MPSNQTANYALNQWSRDDRVLMEDFNADNARIDGAIKAVDQRIDGLEQSKAEAEAVETLAASIPRIVTGHYTGDGQTTRFIDLGFTPQAVLVFGKGGYTYYVTGTYNYNLYGGLAVTGHPVTMDGETVLSVQPGGFQVLRKQMKEGTTIYYNAYLNSNNVGYMYIAIG